MHEFFNYCRTGRAAPCCAPKMQLVGVDGCWSTQHTNNAAISEGTLIQWNPDPRFHCVLVHSRTLNACLRAKTCGIIVILPRLSCLYDCSFWSEVENSMNRSDGQRTRPFFSLNILQYWHRNSSLYTTPQCVLSQCSFVVSHRFQRNTFPGSSLTQFKCISSPSLSCKTN